MQSHNPVYRHRRRWWMGRDKVLGLSLAILVIGIAAAFCFRNEQFVENGLKLARANVLDEAIAKLPGPKPYPQETKPAKPKATLPTVTLNGIESVDPFVERQASATPDREKTVKPVEHVRQSPPVKLAAAYKKASIPMSLPAIDTRTATDGPTASIDTDKAAPDIMTSKLSTEPAFPAEKPAAESSTLLTSTAPPVTESTGGDKEPVVGEIVIRPNAASGSRSTAFREHAVREHAVKEHALQEDAVQDHNVAWQSKAAEEHHETTAENSPRIEPKNDDSSSDDPHRDECTRDNPTRDIPGRASQDEANAEEKSTRDTPVAIDSPHGDRVTTDANSEPATPETDRAAKSILHRVRRGDMLTKIALHYLGDSRRYREIFEANRDQLRTPNDRLKIGMMLRIPENTAPPVHTDKVVAKRKTRSSRSSRSTIGTTGGSKIPVHNAARLREKPPAEKTEEPTPAATDDQNMQGDNHMQGDNSSANRFVPVERAPFLPGTKGQADQSSPIIKPQMKVPVTSYRSAPRRAPITLAGDREDATIR
jgi:LysM domain